MTDIVKRQHGNGTLLVIFWLYVGIPLAWGVLSTFHKALALFC
ncbi:MAG TPA: hypothetical protein VF428_13045 [Casimicrobiaceae bacterium]